MEDRNKGVAVPRRTAEAMPVSAERPGGLRGLFERMAAAIGNADDMVDDRRGWIAARRDSNEDED